MNSSVNGELPELTPENVETTLERLVNGGVCKKCKGKGKYIPINKYHNINCRSCNGTGGTEPDLRMIDALVCRELGHPLVELDGEYFHTLHDSFKSTHKVGGIRIPAYTTDWAYGGPLLEEVPEWKIFNQSHKRYKLLGYRVSVWDEDNKWVCDFTHKSELVARVCSWLILQVKTKW